MTPTKVTMGYTIRGHWVAVWEADKHKLIGPFSTHAEANIVAQQQANKLGLHGMYHGVAS
ncbi:hypothetical protein [Gellertiella hungarica]|uniref:DUF2188 domain-containing protein n=2 Tax=Gellertiella hungarica TaxID=1572859 RepID=A0A7W6NJV6_9HYPH|nr:hypothetical protein [Gellertiella hungarica]